LLDELREATPSQDASRVDAPSAAPRWSADNIYRAFFKAGICVVLTLGATWGMIMLLRIAWSGSFAPAGVHEVNAHGHAQIFGWVGLFVMGFAYQAFPRFKHTSLAHPQWAYASLWLMVSGLVLRSILQVMAAWQPSFIPAAIFASVVEIGAILIFAYVIGTTWHASGKALTAGEWYAAAAIGWFIIQAVYESVYLAATLYASGPALIRLVATWQAPLRDMQIHGFALLMIFGVSLRLLHGMYGFAPVANRISVPALLGINAAVIGESAGLVLMWSHGHGWAALWYGAVLLLALTCTLMVVKLNPFTTPVDTDRSLKFVRAAYVWLLISLAMLVALPIYQFGLLSRFAPDSAAARMGFSHAYYGAVRHAITVGFISLMIVGVASKIVPTLNGLDLSRLPSLWLPFCLLNVGCAWRVIGQSLTDFTSGSFAPTGVSGVLEVTGLAVWGIHLWRIMAGRYQEPASEVEKAERSREPILIRATHLVGDVIAGHPELLPIFQAFGFRPLANPLLRRTLARRVTIAQACRLVGVNERELLAALNSGRQECVQVCQTRQEQECDDLHCVCAGTE
jgi:hypothetical protein